MRRRFWIGLALAVPVVILEMGGHVPGLGLHDIFPPGVSAWIQLVLATPVVLWAGWPFFQRAWASLVSRNRQPVLVPPLGSAHPGVVG